ncbi:hypothetical protein [Streptacidiphilus sp. PAMC 29251]
MRRIPLSLALTAALLPVLLTTSAGPASAAGSSLTVTTLGRNGTRVASSLMVLGLNDGSRRTLSANKLHSLPKGRYGVVVDIQNQKGVFTDTLAAQIVTVSGRTSLTLDARKGKAVKVSVDAAGRPADSLTAQVCAGGWANGIQAGNAPGSLFVIPNSNKALSFAYLAGWHGEKNYVVSGATRAGIPSSPGGRYAATSLARATYQVRANEEKGSMNLTALQPEPAVNSCQTDLFTELAYGTAPYTVSTYVSPGRWMARDDIEAPNGDFIDFTFAKPQTYAARGSYSRVFNRAVWGPVHALPEVAQRAIQFSPDSMITDPTPVPSSSGGMPATATNRATVQLTKGGKLIKKSTLHSYGNGPQEFTGRISTAGWYRLTVDASRYRPGVGNPAGLLSQRTTLNLHFYANPAKSQTAPVFLTTFTPAGLNGYNHAAPGSTTAVGVAAGRDSQGDTPLGKDKVKTLKVWASTNNGKTWHAVAVTRTGSTWSAKVHNPASGEVSLRSVVTDASGNSSTETVYGAYGIG